MAIAMISAALSNSDEHWHELASVSAWAEQTLALDKVIKQMTQRYRYMSQCVVLGRGFNYATAFEWALKLKELTYLIAEPYSSADFQHGPIAMVEGGFPILAVAPSGKVQDSMRDMLTHLAGKRRGTVVISTMRVAGASQSPIMPPQIPNG
jgi:glucosamine--fructose-6-phosphate aminotransferase (isomerizing)